MDNSPTCLVLLASCNGEKWIEAQVYSILDQAGVRVSLLINDDASSDRTTELIEEIALSRDNVVLQKNPISSGSAGKNFMGMFRQVSAQGYDYVALSDQDDIWLPDKLQVSISKLRESSASGVSSPVLAFWENGRRKLFRQTAKKTSCDFLFEGGGQGCTFVLESKFFARIGAFCSANRELTDQFYYHDWLIYLLCRCFDADWIFAKSASIMYRQHGGNDTGARSGLGPISHRLKLIFNGWYANQILVALRIVRASGYTSEHVSEFELILSRPASLERKVMLFWFLLKNGRRGIVDRLALALTGLLGFL